MQRYARTERDLRWLALNFTAGNITKGIAERLECLAAWHRLTLEAETARQGHPDPERWAALNKAYGEAIERMRAAGVGDALGEYTFSPCCGPDEP